MSRMASFSLQFDSFRAFVDEYSSRLSERALFLVTDSPEAIGTAVEFSLGLSDEFRLLQGSGEVVWIVQESSGETPSGMAIRILEVDEPTERLLARLVENQRKKGGKTFSVKAPPEAATVAADASPQTPAASPRTPTAEMDAPAIELTSAIDLGGTQLIPTNLGSESQSFPLDDDSVDASPFQSEPSPPDDAVPTAEPADSEADLLSMPDLAAPEPPVRSAAPEPTVVVPIPEPFTPDAVPEPPAPAAPPGELDPFAAADSDPFQTAGEPGGTFFEESAASIAPPVEMPDLQTSASWLPDARSESGKSSRPYFKIALAITLVAAALFAVGAFMGDFTRGFGQAEVAETLGSPGAADPVDGEGPAGTPSGEEAPLVLAGDADPPPAETGAEAVATAPPTRTREAARPTAASDPAPRLTGIERLTWSETRSGTLLEILADGRIEPSAFEVIRVDSGAPRAVIKIRGVSRPYSTSATPVNTAQIKQVRSGFHVLPEGSEIHLVADLTSSAVEIAVASVEGARLRIRFTGG